MLEFSKQKINVREVINESLDFLLHKNEIPKGRVQYAAFSYKDDTINYIPFMVKEDYLNYDISYEIDENNNFIILKFLEKIEDDLISLETLSESLNEHFTYNEIDFSVSKEFLMDFLVQSLMHPVHRKYTLKVSEQLIKNAYCHYMIDVLTMGKIPKDNSNILEYLKNNDDTDSVKEYIIKLNQHDYLRKDNLAPYLFQQIKEKLEVKYIYHFIKSTFKKMESFTKVKQFNNLEIIKESYNKNGEYVITEQDVYALYIYHNKDINDLYYFLVEPYSIYETNKETRLKEFVKKVIPLFRLNDKVFLQKIMKELKKNY